MNSIKNKHQKAIDILEREIAELKATVDKLKEGQPFECVIKCKTKPVENKPTLLEMTDIKQVEIMCMDTGDIHIQSSIRDFYLRDFTLVIIK